MFETHQKDSEISPPIKAARKQAFLRAHYQASVWIIDLTVKPNFPCLKDFDRMEENGRFIPMMTPKPPR